MLPNSSDAAAPKDLLLLRANTALGLLRAPPVDTFGAAQLSSLLGSGAARIGAKRKALKNRPFKPEVAPKLRVLF